MRLIGRIQTEHLDELKTRLDLAKAAIAVDLDEVTLLDMGAVRFLIACERIGIELLHCWPYI